jgi:SAM-dependent methyltransferase
LGPKFVVLTSTANDPNRRVHRTELRRAVRRLRRKLFALDVADLDISRYSKEYLEASRANGAAQLNVFADILAETLAQPLMRGDATIVDYGGGNGLIALLAREAGIGGVIYNDIFERSCTDARTIAARLGLEADHYVPGDLDDLIRYLADNAITVHGLCSYDVIEHVYEIEPFLRELPRVTTGPLRIVMASAANDRNPRIRRRLMDVQRRVEHEDGVGLEGRDSMRAYRTMRAEIIRRYAPELDDIEVTTLADETRGLTERGIRTALERFRDAGTHPPPLVHPTNTCDPMTGNWAEHLMDPFALAGELSRAGMRASVEPGRYGFYQGIRGAIALPLNLLIGVLGERGLMLAPHYVLIGVRP